MESMDFEVIITVNRPSYSTECDYCIDLSDEDIEAIENTSSWEELPQDLYERVYNSILEVITDELCSDGIIGEGENASDSFEFYIVHPNESSEDMSEDYE